LVNQRVILIDISGVAVLMPRPVKNEYDLLIRKANQNIKYPPFGVQFLNKCPKTLFSMAI